jgi:hypothetical protein
VAHTFDELVEMQHVANDARAKVLALRDTYGPPTQAGWTKRQTETYETALRAWRDLDRDVQAAVTQYSKVKGKVRSEVEADVKEHTKGPEG